MSSTSDDEMPLTQVRQRRAATAKLDRSKGNQTPFKRKLPDTCSNDDDVKDTAKRQKGFAKRRRRAVQNSEKSLEDSSDDEPSTQQGPNAMRQKSDIQTDLSCPHCSKTMSTKLSLQYHVEHLVCQKEKNKTEPANDTNDDVEEKSKTKTKRTNKHLVTTEHSDSEGADGKDDSTAHDESGDDDSCSKEKCTNRGPKEDRTCPHCFKVISTKLGLQYHINNFVCRKEDGPPPRTGLKRKRGKGRAKVGKSNNRGKIEDRTCATCSRVFTSMLGCKYHVQHQVCKKVGVSGEMHQCDTLQAGSRFVTPYGVVEVIRDDRAIPTAVIPPDIRAQQKRFNSHKDRLDRQQLRAQANSTVLSLLRRYRLNQIYAAKDFEGLQWAYFGGQRRPVIKVDEELKWKQDPSYPDDSFPDRMVECKLIPDERSRIVGESGDENQGETRSIYCPTKLFLRRRILDKPYVADITVYVCAHCGAEYNSKDGFVYHCRSEVCTRKQSSRLIAAEEYFNGIELRVSRSLRTNRLGEKKKRRMQTIAVYPDVWKSLGFNIPPEVPEPIELDDEDLISIKGPEETLEALRKQLQITRNSELGAFYPGVWLSLGFKRPKNASTKKGDRIQPQRRKKEALPPAEEPAKAIFPPPPIIDMQVLVDEAGTGRYPSVQRFAADHDTACKICKVMSGKVYKCTFCKQVVHLHCMRTRVTIKDPEPEDDFMCFSCIKYILARRRRAEKRRFQKQEFALVRAAGKRAEEAAAAEQQKMAEEEQKSNEPKFESEYHRVAFMGQELSELIELLSDATTRLNQLGEASRANDIRRSLF